MKISKYDEFQATIRSEVFFESIVPECKTVLDCIRVAEAACGIKSPPGSPWVNDLLAQAMQTHKKKRL